MAAPRAASRLLQGLAMGLAGAALALGLWAAGWLDGWEARTWDWRVRLLARPGAATNDIRLILLDQASLDWGARENGLSWPWPREVYAAVVAFCQRAGVASLTFDVLFTEPSAYGPTDDAALATALTAAGRCVLPVFLHHEAAGADRWPPESPAVPAWPAGLAGPTAPRATLPVAPLEAVAAALGNVALQPDSDGVYRRAALFSRFDDRAVPSLGVAPALLGSRALAVEPGAVGVAGGRAVLDDEGRAILRFRGPSGTHRSYSAAAVIQSELRLQAGQAPSVASADLAGRHVFFGFSAPGLFDLRPAPVGGVYPGVEIFATQLDNLLSGDAMRPTPGWALALATGLLTVLAGLAGVRFHGPAQAAGLSLAALSLPLAAVAVAYQTGVWLPLLPLETAAAAVVFGTVLLNYATEGRQKRFIKHAFAQYLSPMVIEELLRHPDRLTLGGERRELTIFFSDLAGFTTLSEGLAPEALTALLNDYLSAMTDIILDEGGTVDKYEGDAIIAFWNAPLDQPDHAVRAVRAALRCQARLAELRPAFHQRCGQELRTRIGLNTGPAVVGNLGSRHRFDYSILGDAVNLASRLEGANKAFGTWILLSEATHEACQGAFPVREVAALRVVGKAAAVRVFEPYFPESPPLDGQGLAAFLQAQGHFVAGDFVAAQHLFATLPDDPVARAYVARCAAYAHTPPLSWDGVWVLENK